MVVAGTAHLAIAKVIMRTDDDGKRWSTPSSSTQEKVTKQTKIRQKEGGKNI
jgi:hypothetical protein